MDDITVDEEDDIVLVSNEQEEEPLSMKLLKMNVARFKQAFKPIKFAIQLVGHIVQWKNPALTSILFVVRGEGEGEREREEKIDILSCGVMLYLSNYI